MRVLAALVLVTACAGEPYPPAPPPGQWVVSGRNRPVCDTSDGLDCRRYGDAWVCEALPRYPVPVEAELP